MNAPIRVHYYRVPDLDYPRNRRIRAYLTSIGMTVTVARPSTKRSRVGRQWDDLRRLWVNACQSDVLVLSEMRLKHAALVSGIGRLTRTPVVVDGFIGLHETYVGDWGTVPPRSLRAFGLRLLDQISVAVSDLYLTDTEIRAEQVRSTHPRAHVLSLPVGAPQWATWSTPQPHDRLEVLYYGNYIPLHGLDLVIDAVNAVSAERPIRLTLIGDGGCRPDVEHRAKAAGILPHCRFLPPVPETELSAHIAAADVVLGVFGSSDKAQSVIANKVWQGIASGRRTVTQSSRALDEITDAAGPLLVATEPGSAASLAAALNQTSNEASPEFARSAAARLDAIVTERFAALDAHIRRLVER